jgi:deoxyhypusine synthase
MESSSAPQTATDAVLVISEEMPEGSKVVEGINFDKHEAKFDIDDIIKGMATSGFQASALGEAVRIINEMVSS